jgi:hypothetical protein
MRIKTFATFYELEDKDANNFLRTYITLMSEEETRIDEVELQEEAHQQQQQQPWERCYIGCILALITMVLICILALIILELWLNLRK